MKFTIDWIFSVKFMNAGKAQKLSLLIAVALGAQVLAAAPASAAMPAKPTVEASKPAPMAPKPAAEKPKPAVETSKPPVGVCMYGIVRVRELSLSALKELEKLGGTITLDIYTEGILPGRFKYNSNEKFDFCGGKI